MKILLFLSMFFAASLAYANPGVTKNTDIGKRKATSHNQVTTCSGDSCTINTVVRFNKKTKGKKISFGECVFSEESNLRISECKTSKKKKVKTVTKTINKTKKNRLQVHVGYGTDGLVRSKSTNNSETVEEDRKLVVGGQYTRALTSDFNLGVSVFTNSMATFTFGFDY